MSCRLRPLAWPWHRQIAESVCPRCPVGTRAAAGPEVVSPGLGGPGGARSGLLVLGLLSVATVGAAGCSIESHSGDEVDPNRDARLTTHFQKFQGPVAAGHRCCHPLQMRSQRPPATGAASAPGMQWPGMGAAGVVGSAAFSSF
jgi:hypothetical protein